MKNTLSTWIWSLGVVARSYRTVIILGALMAFWSYAGYEWLGLAESSALLLILALVWGLVQLIAALILVGGTAAASVEVAASAQPGTASAEAGTTTGRTVLVSSIWSRGWRRAGTTLLFGLLALLVIFLFSTVFNWINGHSVEVASFLSFHSQKPFSHYQLEDIYTYVEDLVWVAVAGFLLTYFLTILASGWGTARRYSGKLLVTNLCGSGFLTSLISTVVFGGLAFKLANWQPIVPPGFWDYTQMIVRFSLVLILISAGVLFASLALARLRVDQAKDTSI